MRLRFFLFFGFLSCLWTEPSVQVFLSDENGNVLSEKSTLKIGQTILFRIKSTQPESVDNVMLETWNAGISHYEGITNYLSSEKTFDIPYVVPNSSVYTTLSFDVVVRSKTGGRQHFFINKPPQWDIKENSFLESLIELNKRLKVDGLSIDHQSPIVENIVSKKKKKGTLVSFDVRDSHPDLTRMRVLDRPAKCFLLKEETFRCESFLEENHFLKQKSNIEILAIDRARNLRKINAQNIYNPTAPIALLEPVIIENCSNNKFEMKLSFRGNSSQIMKVDFFDLLNSQQGQRALASENFALKKTKVLSKKREGTLLKVTLKNPHKSENSGLFKYELFLRDEKFREFFYLLESDPSTSEKSITCKGKILNPNLLQIKEIQE